jgi:hypothetical protein
LADARLLRRVDLDEDGDAAAAASAAAAEDDDDASDASAAVLPFWAEELRVERAIVAY